MIPMIGKKIVGEKYVTQAEAKEILKKREDSDELIYEQNIALNVIEKFIKISQEDAKEMVAHLLEEVPRIKDEHAIKIVDTMPKDKEDLSLIFSKERIILTDDEVAKIQEIVANYR